METLPYFVRVEGGANIFELGEPKEASVVQALDGMKEIASGIAIGGIEIGGVDVHERNLATLTGIVLAGAAAFNLLAHHLTVNIFWV